MTGVQTCALPIYHICWDGDGVHEELGRRDRSRATIRIRLDRLLSSFLHGVASRSNIFASMKIKQLSAKRLGASESHPLPPRPCDLFFIERGLKKVPAGRFQIWAGGGSVLGQRDFCEMQAKMWAIIAFVTTQPTITFT